MDFKTFLALIKEIPPDAWLFIGLGAGLAGAATVITERTARRAGGGCALIVVIAVLLGAVFAAVLTSFTCYGDLRASACSRSGRMASAFFVPGALVGIIGAALGNRIAKMPTDWREARWLTFAISLVIGAALLPIGTLLAALMMGDPP